MEPSSNFVLKGDEIGLFYDGSMVLYYGLSTGKLTRKINYEDSINFGQLPISKIYAAKIRDHNGFLADRLAYSKKHHDRLINIFNASYVEPNQSFVAGVLNPFIYNTYSDNDTTEITVLSYCGYVVSQKGGACQTHIIEHADTHSFSTSFMYNDTLYMNQYFKSDRYEKKIAVFVFDSQQNAYINKGELILKTEEQRVEYKPVFSNHLNVPPGNRMELKVSQGSIKKNSFLGFEHYLGRRYIYDHTNIYDFTSAQPILEKSFNLDSTRSERIKRISFNKNELLILTAKYKDAKAIFKSFNYTLHVFTAEGKFLQTLNLDTEGTAIKYDLVQNNIIGIKKTDEHYEVAVYKLAG
jgi:hypothetical protein